MKIHFVILATNYYVPLGIRLIKKISKFYQGAVPIHIHLFSDKNPSLYLPKSTDNVTWYETFHKSWVDATNSKFDNILTLGIPDDDYVFYLDADTNLWGNFTEEGILGDLVGAQHFNDGDEHKPYDRNKMSKSFIPYNTKLKQMYFQGAFFGGKVEYVKLFCKILRLWQEYDRKIPYEPGVNDESYINKFFHISPPKVILTTDFPFVISDKGGITNQRAAKPVDENQVYRLIYLREDQIDIVGGRVVSEVG